MRIDVRGDAGPEEVAAVLAVIARAAERPAVQDPYRRWRETRQSAISAREVRTVRTV